MKVIREPRSQISSCRLHGLRAKSLEECMVHNVICMLDKQSVQKKELWSRGFPVGDVELQGTVRVATSIWKAVMVTDLKLNSKAVLESVCRSNSDMNGNGRQVIEGTRDDIE